MGYSQQYYSLWAQIVVNEYGPLRAIRRRGDKYGYEVVLHDEHPQPDFPYICQQPKPISYLNSADCS